MNKCIFWIFTIARSRNIDITTQLTRPSMGMSACRSGYLTVALLSRWRSSERKQLLLVCRRHVLKSPLTTKSTLGKNHWLYSAAKSCYGGIKSLKPHRDTTSCMLPSSWKLTAIVFFGFYGRHGTESVEISGYRRSERKRKTYLLFSVAMF